MATLRLIMTGAALLFLALGATAGNGDWLNLTNSNHITAITHHQNDLWVGSRGGGMVKVNLRSGEKTFYNMANSGLPSNKVEAIQVDAQNTVWIGTYDQGLVRYDGQQWQVFNTENSNIGRNEVFDVQLDVDGNVWMGTNFGITKYDGSDFTTYPTPGYSAAYTLAIVSPDDIYLAWNVGGSFTNEMYHFNGDSITKIEDNYFSGIYKLYLDAQQRVWVCHDKGVAYKDGNQWMLFDSTNSILPGAQARSMAEWNGQIYVGTDEGIFTYNGTQWTAAPTTIGQANYMAPVGNQLYIGTLSSGLYKTDGANLQPIQASNSLIPTNWLSTGTKDLENKLLFNTSVGSGLLMFEENQWSFLSASERIGNYHHVAIGTDNSYWYVSYDSLYHYNTTGLEGWNLDSIGMPSSGISALAVAPNGHVYIGTYTHGFMLYDGSTFKLYNRANSNISSNRIQCFAFVDGNTWIGTNVDVVQQIQYGGGIEVFNGATFQRMHTGNSGVISNYVSHLIVKGDSVWIGGDGGFGLYYNGNWTKYLYNNGSGNPITFIRHMAVSSTGEVFATGYNINSQGIMIRFDGTGFEVFDGNNSPLRDFAYGTSDILFDQYDNLWLLAPEGIFLYKEGGVTNIDENITSSTATLPSELAVNLYPNPADSYVIIQLPENGKAVIALYNLVGEQVLEESFNGAAHRLDVAQLTPGLYVYQIKTGENYINGKILVR